MGIQQKAEIRRTLPPPQPIWQGGSRAVGLVEVNRTPRSYRNNKHRILQVMPGYGGTLQRHDPGYQHGSEQIRQNPDLPFAPDDVYRRASPRTKTNGKNISAFAFGDNRVRHWLTTSQDHLRPPDGGASDTQGHAPLVPGWDQMTDGERRVIYDKATKRVTLAGIKFLITSVRDKIDQRTSGGPFALRKAFKYFDRDSSGDIDPDEFFHAMNWFGLQFTENQVFALFGSIDDDGGGSIDYYEFIGKVIAQDYEDQAGGSADALRPKPAAERTHSSAICAYRQQLAIKDLFSQLDSMQTGDVLVVPRSRCHEMLKLAAIPEATRDQAEKHVDLLQDVIGLLSRRAISRETFWDWWAGCAGAITGIQDFPIGGTSFSMIKPSSQISELRANRLEVDGCLRRSDGTPVTEPDHQTYSVAPALANPSRCMTARTSELPRLDFRAAAPPPQSNTPRTCRPVPPERARAPLMARAPITARCYQPGSTQFGRTWGTNFGDTRNGWAAVGAVSPRVTPALRSKVLNRAVTRSGQGEYSRPSGSRFNSGYVI